MKFFIIVIFFLSFKLYALDPFYMREITITEWSQNPYLFEMVNIELLRYIQGINIYINNIEINNFEHIYQFRYDSFEEVYLIFYKTGNLYQRYYVIFILTDNNMTEIKLMEISIINRQSERWPNQIPFPIRTQNQ
jgi:hypothetical protein